MIDSKWRNGYQKICVNPLLPLIKRCHPSLLTMAALLFGLTIPLFCFLGIPQLAFLALVLSGYFDTLDGTVARLRGLTSPLGAVLDITADRLVEFAVILGLFFIAPEARGLHCLLMVGSAFICITTFLVVGIFTKNDSEKGFYYSPGIIERAEAFLLFGAMLLIPTLFTWFAVIFSLAVFLTALLRVWEFAKLVDPEEVRSPYEKNLPPL